MKVRNGFVSNSSSSSFIIEGDATISQVALTMMYEIRHCWSEWKEKDAFDWTPPESFGKAIQWLTDNRDYDEPLLLPWSTNEETFIWRHDGIIMVKTCNNHDWSLVGPRYTEYEDTFYEQRKLHIFLDLDDMRHKTHKQFWDEQMAKWEERRKANENS